MVVTRAVKLSLLQQSQASVPLSFIIWHLSTIPLNVIFASTQAETCRATPWSTLICSDEERQLTSVMFGRGMFSVEQAVFTLASQPLRSAARAVKFFAPLLVVEPWQESAALLPPPDLKVVFRLFVGPIVFFDCFLACLRILT